MSEQNNVYIEFRASVETISGHTKNIRELRGIEPPKDEPSKNETNPYDRLEPDQFNLAMHTAYTNIVRMQHFGQSMSDTKKDKALTEINRLMESAQKRFPYSKSETKGSYFTDPKLQDTEAQLLAYIKSSEAKYGKDADNNTMKYDAWRQGKNFKMPLGGDMTLCEKPYENTALYGTSDERFANSFTAKDLLNPLETGSSLMTEKDVAAAKARLEKLTIRRRGKSVT